MFPYHKPKPQIPDSDKEASNPSSPIKDVFKRLAKQRQNLKTNPNLKTDTKMNMEEGDEKTPTSLMKKELQTLTLFTGKREDLRKFLQEVNIYLLANGHVYATYQDNILFVLSFMSEGDTNSWKKEFFEAAKQMNPFTLEKYD
jgi:hypothetical protein